MARVKTEGEHPVSAKFRGLRNRLVRWWVLRAPHEQLIFTSVFEKDVIFAGGIFAGANRVSAAFQLHFSCVSAAFQLRFSCVSATFQLRFSSLEVLLKSFLFRWSQNIRVPQSQTFGQTFCVCVSAAFQLAKTGSRSHSAHPLVKIC